MTYDTVAVYILGVELFLDVGRIVRVLKNQARLLEIETSKSHRFRARVFIDASYEGGKLSFIQNICSPTFELQSSCQSTYDN